MKENIDKTRDPLFRLIQEAGPEEVDSGFLLSVLDQLDKKSILTSYKPIISRKSWLVFGLIFIIILLISIFQAPTETTWTDILYISNNLKLPAINIQLPSISIPTIFKTNIMAQSVISFIILSFAFIIIRNKLIELK